MPEETLTAEKRTVGHGRRHYAPLMQQFSDLLAEIDAIDPGFYGFVMRLSDGRRHAALLVLSVSHDWEAVPVPGFEDVVPLKSVAKDIRTLPVRELIEKYVRPVSEGLHGALNKIGSSSWVAVTYRTLSSLFNNPDRGGCAAVIRQLEKITSDTVRVVNILAAEPVFLRPAWIQKLNTDAANDLVTVVSLFRDMIPDWNEASFENSARDAKADLKVDTFVVRWLAKIGEVPFPAFDLPPEIRPLNSAAKLSEIGREYQNCLGGAEQIVAMLSGRDIFYEHEGHKLVAHVSATGAGHYTLIDIYRPENVARKGDEVLEMEAAFIKAGIPSQFWTPPNFGRWRSVHRLMARRGWFGYAVGTISSCGSLRAMRAGA